MPRAFLPQVFVIVSTLGTVGCFSEPDPLRSTSRGEADETDSLGRGSTESSPTHDAATSQGETAGTTVGIATIATGDGQESYGTNASGTGRDTTDSGADLLPDGSACQTDEVCEGGLCAGLDGIPPACTTRCDPAVGGCAVLGRETFCLRVTPQDYGCLREIRTGRDGEDSSLTVGGPTRTGEVAGSDRDLFYLYLPAPGVYPVVLSAAEGLGPVIHIYKDGLFQGTYTLEDPVTDIRMDVTDTDPGRYPGYFSQIVVAARQGTSGSYSIRMEEAETTP